MTAQIYTSDLGRALQTVQAISSLMGHETITDARAPFRQSPRASTPLITDYI
jgi:broad specificity phosphatase PhoE